ncbi:MAG: hypothetical protein ACFB2Y_04640 [Fulvivirga sp.]
MTVRKIILGAVAIFCLEVTYGQGQDEIIDGRLQITSTADVGAGQTPALVIGDRNGHHIGIDGNEIGAFLNNSNADLYINASQSTSNTIINGDGTGYVGIGTSSPSALLDVKRILQNGDFMVLGLDGVNPRRLSFGVSSWSGVMGLYDGGNVQRVRISSSTSDGGYTYFDGPNVLIGKTSQSNTSYKLDVAGKVRANEIVVNTTGADYVFEENYKLKSLREVEAFINENNHLPGIPSATEMQAQGMSVGELNTKLLEKIEELTLHTINQQKEIEELKSEQASYADLESRLEELALSMIEMKKENQELNRRIKTIENE